MTGNLELEINWLFRDKYQGRWNPEFIKDALRLKKGEPTAYVIGWQPFLNCKIDLSLRPLVPRPETEYWTEKAIGEMKRSHLRQGYGGQAKIKIADVFSGSGCIGIAALSSIKNTKVDFFEIDKKAARQIRINLRINRISSSRCHIFQGDASRKLKGLYDFILANPPYLALNRKRKIQSAVLKYEPTKALFGGNDGLLFIKKFLRLARRHLKKEGQIWMEFDSWQKKEIEKLLKKFGYRRWQFFRDQYGRWRYVQIFY
jgi:release factor glutamine methyltransferase